MATQRRPRKRAASSIMDHQSAPTIDFLMVADRAEAVNGKLYMMGGAWDRLYMDVEQPVSFFVALGVIVPWTATNVEHQVTITLETEDGQVLEPMMRATINVGRPPIAERGQSFRAILVARAQFKLPKRGAYVLVANLPGQQSRRTVFYVLPANVMQGPTTLP